jgi:hypothetical protein
VAASAAGAAAGAAPEQGAGQQAGAAGAQHEGAGAQQLGAEQPQQRRARSLANRPQHFGAQQLGAAQLQPPPQAGAAHEQPQPRWNRPAEAFFSAPTREMPTNATKVAMPKNNARFILNSSHKTGTVPQRE